MLWGYWQGSWPGAEQEVLSNPIIAGYDSLQLSQSCSVLVHQGRSSAVGWAVRSCSFSKRLMIYVRRKCYHSLLEACQLETLLLMIWTDPESPNTTSCWYLQPSLTLSAKPWTFGRKLHPRQPSPMKFSLLDTLIISSLLTSVVGLSTRWLLSS